MPPKKQKNIFLNLDFGPNYSSDIILVNSQIFSHFCPTLFCPIIIYLNEINKNRYVYTLPP